MLNDFDMTAVDVLVIGGGPAGLESAYSLANNGYDVAVLEKEKNICGHLNQAHSLFPNFQNASEVRSAMIDKMTHPKISIHNDTEAIRIKRDIDKWGVETGSGKEFMAPALLLATGFKSFDPKYKEELGYGIYDNVITTTQFEAMCQKGSIVSPHGQKVKRIAFLNCVGSRDEKVGNHYCSRVCCINAVKQSIEAKKVLPEADIYCFYMDIRMAGQFYEELYRKSQEVYNVNYIRGRISEVSPTIDKRLHVKCEDTLSQTPMKITFDILVLMTGIEASLGTVALGQQLNISGEYNFAKSLSLHMADNYSSHKGLFLAGTCKRPLTLPEAVADARSAAGEIKNYLKTLKQ